MRWSFIRKLVSPLAYTAVICGIGTAVWFGRPYWQPLIGQSANRSPDVEETSIPVVDKPKTLELNAQARANLNLKSAPVKAQTYWRNLQIPGVIEDRPGLTDRGITAPLSGVVTRVHAFEGDIIQPGEKLFTIRLVSEYLQQSQSDLFKTSREVEILNHEIDRIQGLVTNGSLPGKRKLELEQQISRQNAKIDAFRQDLTSRGLSEQQVNQIQKGNFLKTIEIVAPPASDSSSTRKDSHFSLHSIGQDFFEIQKLKVELGQQVQAGEALAVLANHYSLFIKGHAFKKEASRLAKAAKESWDVEVEFTEDAAEDWPPIKQKFQVRHLSNTTDPTVAPSISSFRFTIRPAHTRRKVDRLLCGDFALANGSTFSYPLKKSGMCLYNQLKQSLLKVPKHLCFSRTAICSIEFLLRSFIVIDSASFSPTMARSAPDSFWRRTQRLHSIAF